MVRLDLNPGFPFRILFHSFGQKSEGKPEGFTHGQIYITDFKKERNTLSTQEEDCSSLESAFARMYMDT